MNSAAAKKAKILIVDDEEDLREAIAFDFERKSYEVYTAASGNAALSFLQKTPVDLVLTDIHMPDGNGVVLLDTIREKSTALPVLLFLTGHSDLSLEEAYAKGADAIFSKPYDRDALFAAVSAALLSAESRYARKNPRVNIEVPVGIKFQTGSNWIQSKIQNLGRGGFFIHLDREFPEVGDHCDFNLGGHAETNLSIVGSGIVRWCRSDSGGSAGKGCGIEFTELEPGSLTQVIETINQVKIKAFIPSR